MWASAHKTLETSMFSKRTEPNSYLPHIDSEILLALLQLLLKPAAKGGGAGGRVAKDGHLEARNGSSKGSTIKNASGADAPVRQVPNASPET